MALYPTLTESPFITIGQSIDQKVLKSSFDDLGKIQVKRKWLYPRRSLQLDYFNILNTELRELEQFYVDRNGSYSVFTFIMPTTESSVYTSEYVGTGNGSTLIFNLPFKSGSAVTIYTDGNEQSTPTNYSIEEDAGQDGVDKLTFEVAPSAGARVTADFTGPLVIRCRFMNTIEFLRSRTSLSLNSLSVTLSGTLIDE